MSETNDIKPTAKFKCPHIEHDELLQDNGTWIIQCRECKDRPSPAVYLKRYNNRRYGNFESKTLININWIAAWWLVTLTLKLTGTIAWSWWWILAPMWIPIIILLVVIIYLAYKKAKHQEFMDALHGTN